ncbi:MAG: hypothetical protein NVSMB52_12200 [Chloroflexota bacterium]
MTEERGELTKEELEKQAAQELPEREEMSVIQGIQPMPPVFQPVPPEEV